MSEMSVPVITGLYAAIMGLLLVWLDLQVGRLRARTGVSLYDGGNKELATVIRKQGNFTEHVPLVLVLMALVEFNGAPAWLLNCSGVALVVARIVHPMGLDYEKMANPLRAIGVLITLLVILVLSGYGLYQYFGG